MTTYIHINRNVIFKNAKHGTNDPPIKFHKGKSGKPTYAHEVQIEGPSQIYYSAHKPLLRCGARLVIVTQSEVKAL